MNKRKNGNGKASDMIVEVTNGEVLNIIPHEVNVDRLLKDLHEKKQWLDTMIVALERAALSPDHQLIEEAGRVFDHFDGSRPKVDLRPRQQRKLADLAQQVGKVRHRRTRVANKAA